MKKLLVAISAFGIAATAAFAGPADDREALMKERGKIVGELSKMAKGETPFDAAAITAAFQTLQANAAKGADVAALWPEGSIGDTEASPKIWEDAAGFQAAADKFKADVDGVVAAGAPADAAALGAAFGKVAANCGSCHESFRIKK